MGKHDRARRASAETLRPAMLREGLAVPSPSPQVEAERRRALRLHKTVATGLLLFATAIYLLCRWLEAQPGDPATWVGFVRAAAEAGMIGGLADWFAVTALFRRPLHLPIPHTAIVRHKKDQIGQSLSGFVGENFLNAELITEKVTSAHIPERLGEWLSNPVHAERVSHEAGKLLANVTRALNPEDAETIIRHGLIDRIAEPQWGPPVGRTLHQLLEEGKAEPVVDAIAQWLHDKALGSEQLINRMLGERAPTWAPQFINDLVGDKVYREFVSWSAAVATNPEHQARAAMRRVAYELADKLQHDPETMAQVERWKADLLASNLVQETPAKMWESTSVTIIEAAEKPSSVLRRKITELAQYWGDRIRTEPALRASVDRRMTGAAAFLADNYSEEITSIISETIERWDADEASDKIELMVGKDLQFIRLNGTIVGALAGVAIYTVSHVLFGA